MAHDVYICYSYQDKMIADIVCEVLERNNIRCWIAPRDVLPGTAYGDAISETIKNSYLMLLLYSSHSNQSRQVIRELESARNQNILVIPFRIENVKPSGPMELFLGAAHWFDAILGDKEKHAEKLAETFRLLLETLPRDGSKTKKVVSNEPRETSKGYIFISYVKSDQDFVQKLRHVLRSKRYGYWDYLVGNRDYHGKLFRELEERIEGAVAFMTIVSDRWRESDWVASEFTYARESNKPIFVIQAKQLQKPLPILLNLQTRIDMSIDFEKGIQVLLEELQKEGL
jgi:hypothetical protein